MRGTYSCMDARAMLNARLRPLGTERGDATACCASVIYRGELDWRTDLERDHGGRRLLACQSRRRSLGAIRVIV